MSLKTFILAALATTGLASPTANILNARAEQHVGHCTYYFFGLGTCGTDQGGQDDSVNLVAIPDEIMGFGPTLADDLCCGRRVTLSANGWQDCRGDGRG